MNYTKPSVINIALVGGGPLCREILEKTTFVQEEVDAPIVAVSDPDPETPGIQLARKLGLLTFSDYHDLYEPSFNIHLIIILTPEPEILESILGTRPQRIRILSYHVFEIFWNTICREERKLREQNKAMETIINGIQDFILVLTPDREVVEVNTSFLAKMGLDREEVLRKKCHEVFRNLDHLCNDPVSGCPLEEAVRERRHTRQVQKRVGRTGKTRHFEVSIHPIWDKDGKIAKFIHISRDITQQLQKEEEITHRLEQMVEERTRELRETHAKLLHQDKMASLGKLSASVVHEINNPISGVLNLTILMKRILREEPFPAGTAQQFERYLDLMETETRRTSRIVSNLLAFSRQSKMEFRPVDINHLIEKTLILNANLLKISRIRLKKELAPDLPHTYGSEDQLLQVFMNLVSNAAEAMLSSGGVLAIRTGVSPREESIWIDFTDTGIGIPKENIPRIFEPFFTTKKNEKGVGLGLSLAYGIIREHDGAIHVESDVDKGATFRVEIPVKRAAPGG